MNCRKAVPESNLIELQSRKDKSTELNSLIYIKSV